MDIKNRPIIGILDDEEDVLKTFHKILAAKDYQVITYHDAQTALAGIANSNLN